MMLLLLLLLLLQQMTFDLIMWCDISVIESSLGGARGSDCLSSRILNVEVANRHKVTVFDKVLEAAAGRYRNMTLVVIAIVCSHSS